MNAATFSSWLMRTLNRFRMDFPANHPAPLTDVWPRLAARPRTSSADETAATQRWSVDVLQSILEIDPTAWDELAGRDNVLRSHSYLSAIEKTAIAGCKFFYPVLRDEHGRIIAHACVYLIDTDLAQLLPGKSAWLVRLVRKFWRRFLVVRITECAAPLSTSHSISISDDLNSEAQISALSDAIEAIARSERSMLTVIRDFLEDDRKQFDALLGQGFNLVSNMPVCRIAVRWRSYDDYLSSMRARYRKDVKRRIRRAQASGQSVHVLESFAPDAALWAEQAHTVQEKTTGFKREVLPPAYYEYMDRLLGSSSLLVVAERDHEFVAHGMVLVDDSTTTATYFGRNRGPAHQEWFHLVNEVIRIGIENNSRFINLGLGSYDAKQNVGADVEPLFVYSRSSLAPVNWLMRRIPETMNRRIVSSKQIFRIEDAGTR